MIHRFVPIVFVAGLAGACRSGTPPPSSTVDAAQPAGQPLAQKQQQVAPLLTIRAKELARDPQLEKSVSVMPDARAEGLAALKKESEDAMSAYWAAFDAALGDNKNPTSEDLQKIQENVKVPDTHVYVARAQKLLDEDATDVTALHTIRWLLDNGRGANDRPALIAMLEKHHLDRVEMGDLCPRLAEDGRALLEKLVANSPHAAVRGRACAAIAEGLKSDLEAADELAKSKPEDVESMKGWLGEERFAALQKLDAPQARKQLEATYERIVKEFGDVQVGVGTKRETTLGQQAQAALFEMRTLAVGQPAPEIEGVDLDKVAFKLSDYRGKIVLLDFWGNW